MTNLHPTEDRLLVKPLKAKEITKGGIVIPASAQEIANRGIVVAAGPGRMGDAGQSLPMSIAVGMVVQYSKFNAGEPFKDENGELHTWMRQSDVLAVVG